MRVSQVSDLSRAYRDLLVSPGQLAACRRADSVSGLLALLKSLWRVEGMSDDALLGELHRFNQQPLDIDANRLATTWLPYGYDAKKRTLAWCLPNGSATEPFQDQTISRYRQQLINQLLNPKTTLASALESPVHSEQPAGFIFHLSRCGSTLVSGSCAELESVSVLSESPALTEALLDTHLPVEQQRQLLQRLVAWQARAVAPFAVGKQRLVIKWNAWDIFRWPLIRSLYPQVPVLLLTRHPVEILASHQRSAGRHMAGDKSLAGFHPVFSTGGDILAMRVRVLASLLDSMATVVHQPAVTLIDYRQLDVESILGICANFGLEVGGANRGRIEQRMLSHTKEPERKFQPDSQIKRQIFDAQTYRSLEAQLMPAYERLFASNA